MIRYDHYPLSQKNGKNYLKQFNRFCCDSFSDKFFGSRIIKLVGLASLIESAATLEVTMGPSVTILHFISLLSSFFSFSFVGCQTKKSKIQNPKSEVPNSKYARTPERSNARTFQRSNARTLQRSNRKSKIRNQKSKLENRMKFD